MLLGGHDLDLRAFAMEVVGLELGAACADVVNAPCDALHDAIELESYWDDVLWAVLLNLGRERARKGELVWVRIWAVRPLQLLYLTASQLIVLLNTRILALTEFF